MARRPRVVPPTPQQELNEHVRRVIRVLMARDRLNQARLAEALGWEYHRLNERMSKRKDTPFTILELSQLASYFRVPSEVFLAEDGAARALSQDMSHNMYYAAPDRIFPAEGAA